MEKKKKKNLKEVREQKHLTYRGTKIRFTRTSQKKMQAKKVWSKIFKVLGEKKKKKTTSLRIPYSVKLSFKVKGK